MSARSTWDLRRAIIMAKQAADRADPDFDLVVSILIDALPDHPWQHERRSVELVEEIECVRCHGCGPILCLYRLGDEDEPSPASADHGWDIERRLCPVHRRVDPGDELAAEYVREKTL